MSRSVNGLSVSFHSNFAVLTRCNQGRICLWLDVSGDVPILPRGPACHDRLLHVRKHIVGLKEKKQVDDEHKSKVAETEYNSQHIRTHFGVRMVARIKKFQTSPVAI